MLKVYQVTERKDPSRLAIRDVMCGLHASKHWKAGMYEHVANVQTSDLDEAFLIMNRWSETDENRVERLEPLHSLSVGDVLVDGDMAFVVASFGFDPL